MLPVNQILADVGRQRTAEARGSGLRRDPWIPDSLDEAQAQAVTDPEVLEAIAFYRESPWRSPYATNRLLFRSNAALLGFRAFDLVPELLTQPLQVVVGGRQGSTGRRRLKRSWRLPVVVSCGSQVRRMRRRRRCLYGSDTCPRLQIG